ncbi:hypothetical protein SLS59_002008 [Nothophoma quercina]|uniref:Fungal N-terminal domain-containing protein n=1 Tax=Nothophoma quercina TaxID=749835 RepID=A0ABR3RXX6_9PLEO
MTVPNVGDILMLSQVAWKTGRAFTAGRKDAPSEFQAVESDVSGLAQALKELAETLHAEVDASLVSQTDQQTQGGVSIILSSCQRTIYDLDSLVDRYQVIRKHRTVGGFAIERSWSDLVLAQYETIMWTTEGGSLHDLSSLLQMHTKSMRLITEAIQIGSVSQLEAVVNPMAERFDSMYDLPGTLEDQLDEVSRFVRDLTIANPVTQAPPIPQRNPARSPIAEITDPLIRKRITDSETRNVRVVTSIWALSDDNNVRIELKMGDEDMYIPYSSYFSPAKVSMTVPCELKFHDVRYGNRLIKTARTSWVNYVFEDAQAAALFQNEIMGRTLLATLRTSKTLRIHEGTLSTFAYAEQMCALENLRIWEDTDTGAVIGLIHFSASFREGYLAFYLNSSNNPVKVQDGGGREVKIKGLRVPIAEAGRAMRKDSVIDDGETITEANATDGLNASSNEKRRASVSGTKKVKGKEKKVEVDRKKVISGAKIEFASETEKREFLELVEEYQKPRRLCELPDLLGVN